MYAVILTGGKQYRVKEGDIVDVERIVGERGSKVVFKEVLLYSNGTELTVGTPYVKNCTVSASIFEQKRLKKIRIIKYTQRKGNIKSRAHRQYCTRCMIEKIGL